MSEMRAPQAARVLLTVCDVILFEETIMPTQKRSAGATSEVYFSVAESSLGHVLAAQTPRGVCAIFLGENVDELERALVKQFPDARRVVGGSEQGAGLDETLREVIDYLHEPGCELDLALEINGTAFQRSVWAQLRMIPKGKTATYTEIANALGKPTAARAVAGACAANLLSVAIPCHRVLRSDGSLSGYRWGVERKRALLEREGALPKQSTI